MTIRYKFRLDASDIAKLVGIGAAFGTAGFIIGFLFNIPSSVMLPIVSGLSGVIGGAMIIRKKHSKQ